MSVALATRTVDFAVVLSPLSPMKLLAKALLRLDGLSHVLAWTKDPVLACKDAAALDSVELPRLRLRFQAKADRSSRKVSYSRGK